MDNVTRYKILGNMTTERDLRNQMRYAIETATAEGLAKGMEQGIAEGRAKGEAEGERAKACEIAAKLIAAGMSKEEAAEFVGIEEGEI